MAALIIGLGGSSAVLSEPVKENIGLFGGNVMDIATMDNSGTTEVLIAVDNSQRGIYKYQAASGILVDRWFSTTNPPTGTAMPAADALPGFASQVEADPFISGHVYATVSNESADEYGVLYFNSDYGSLSSVSPITVGWSAVPDPTSPDPMSGIQVLKAGSSGVWASSHRDIFELSNGAVMGLTFSLDSMAGYEDHEIVDFTIATSSLAYAAVRDESAYGLLSIDLTTGTPSTSATATVLSLPPSAPVVQRSTSGCPIAPEHCMVSAELVATDPVDPTGNTIYIAGSSVNAMVFKSTDGGSTWDQGYDYQCSADTTRTTASCTAYGFTDGYPRGDVVRFRGTSSTSPGESRHVFIGRVVFDNDNVASGWQTVPRLRSLIRPSGASGSAIYQETNANDPALEADPNDSTKFYIATDLAVGTFTHDPSLGFSAPYAGSELANARGIEGLIVNDLDYFENAPDDKQLWIVSKSGAAFAKSYDPTDPSSVASAGDWVYPIYAGGDGAPHRAVVIDPNDKSNVIIGTSKLYLNETGDAIDPSSGVVDYSLVANPMNWARVFDPQDFADDPSADPSTIHPLFSSNVERSYVTSIEWQTAAGCDRVYMSVANTDEGDVGGIFYSDDGGSTWMPDTLNSSSPRFSMPVNDLLVNDNFVWAGVGDRDGRSPETGVRARVSFCGTSAWWKPSSSDPIFTSIQSDDYVSAIDGVSTPSDPTYDAILYMASSSLMGATRLTKAAKERSSVSGCSSFACWKFSDVTPPSTYGSLNAVAVEPTDSDHVWAAFSNCIVESTDGGATWAEFGGSCTDDHEEIRTLVYDDLIAGTSSGAYAYPSDESESSDSDGDGVPDDTDAFPADPAASADADMDGMPDAWNDDATSLQIADSNLTLDEDDDNDGFSDTEEIADGSDPLDPTSIPSTVRSRIPFLIPILSEGPE
ncbi:MAG: thrombospondin type 3 repeat-containing protein [Luminiphilus sp.]|nr:thrombospondin type 3 repeat-containing protein [Luminiphilus sp.]